MFLGALLPAWALVAQDLHQLLGFVTPRMYVAAQVGQWSPT
jgi:hypothetical protein